MKQTMNNTATNTTSKTSGIVTANGIITVVKVSEEAVGITVNSGVAVMYIVLAE